MNHFNRPGRRPGEAIGEIAGRELSSAPNSSFCTAGRTTGLRRAWPDLQARGGQQGVSLAGTGQFLQQENTARALQDHRACYRWGKSPATDRSGSLTGPRSHPWASMVPAAPTEHHNANTCSPAQEPAAMGLRSGQTDHGSRPGGCEPSATLISAVFQCPRLRLNPWRLVNFPKWQGLVAHKGAGESSGATGGGPGPMGTWKLRRGPPAHARGQGDVSVVRQPAGEVSVFHLSLGVVHRSYAW